MKSNYDPSVAELRRESERTRTALTRTVGELRDKVSDTASELKMRVSPSHIKEEIKDYVREGRENLVQSIERKVRDNPLQAAAIGAAVAYPLWGMLRAIPAPILLVGAGLWLTGKGGRRSIAQARTVAADLADTAIDRATDFAHSAQAAVGLHVHRATDAVAEAGAALASGVSSVGDKATAAAHDVRDSIAKSGQSVFNSVAGGTASQTASSASQAMSSVRDTVASAGQTVMGGVRSASDMASQTAAAVSQAASSLGDTITDVGQTLGNSVKSTAQNAADQATQTALAVKDRAAQVAQQSRSGFVDLVDRNPLLVAGVGLAIGAFIAASLPPSNTENRLFGERSDELKNNAREAASQGIERAKDVASEVVGDVTTVAASEGLSADGLKKVVDGLTESVTAVADRGIQTALGEKNPSVSSQLNKS